MSPTRLFVTGTGTGIGKTVFTVALTHAARSRGLRVRAVKPVETGCLGGRAEDALALAAARLSKVHAADELSHDEHIKALGCGFFSQRAGGG